MYVLTYQSEEEDGFRILFAYAAAFVPNFNNKTSAQKIGK